MGFNCGIIGLPNVGKSTIFNALSGANAPMANYPFCTVEPNRGVVTVPDARLYRIAVILGKNDPIPTRIEFVDVAGLVEGASKGEGLGNRFLGNIRDVDALVHVVRCFHDDDVAHVTGRMDPAGDVEVAKMELFLSDMEILERAKEKLERATHGGDRKATEKIETIERCLTQLGSGEPLSKTDFHEEEKRLLREFGLISIKPVLYCANTDEAATDRGDIEKLKSYAASENAGLISISGKLEEEIAELEDEEKEEYIRAMGIEESGLGKLITASYRMLGLITFYTAATTLQAWTITEGTTAVEAAGRIHTDFERGFVRAQVYHCSDLEEAGSEAHLRESGKLRSEGKEYPVKDGDVVRFLFNV